MFQVFSTSITGGLVWLDEVLVSLSIITFYRDPHQ